MMVNVQAQSLKRTEYINRYVKELKSIDSSTRAFAVWSLGNFQSKIAIDALFDAAVSETNQPILCGIKESLAGGQMLDIFALPSIHTSIIQVRSDIAAYKTKYESSKYPDFILEDFKLLSVDGKRLFLDTLCEHYDPLLLATLLEIRDVEPNANRQMQIARAVRAWSGYDLISLPTASVKAALLDVNAMNDDSIYARYIAYFRANGYQGVGSNNELPLAILYNLNAKNDQFVRGMALRMIEHTAR